MHGDVNQYEAEYHQDPLNTTSTLYEFYKVKCISRFIYTLMIKTKQQTTPPILKLQPAVEHFII